MKFLARLGLLVLMTAAVVVARQAADGPAIVISSSGWTGGAGQFKRGDRVTPGVSLSGSEGGALLLECGASGMFVYECRQKAACRIQACREAAADGVAIRTWAPSSRSPRAGRSAALLTREPKEPIIAAARAGGNPSDAVVLQDARGTHWGPVLNRILEGTYCLRVTPLPDTGTGWRVVPITWDREVDAEGLAPTAGLTPGLYAVRKGSGGSACEPDPDGTAAWALVVSAGDFARVSQEWKQASGPIGDLERSGAANSIVVASRHLLLADLAESVSQR